MKDNGKKKKAIIIILVLCLLVAIGGGICILNRGSLFGNPNVSSSSGSTKKLDNDGSAIDGMETPKTSQQVLDELKKSEVNVTDNLSSYILFPSGKTGTAGNWVVQNLKTNNVTMQCEVFLNNKLIAKSVPIRPDVFGKIKVQQKVAKSAAVP